MELLVLVWRQYRWPFISVMALSLASAALGIGLIAFINQRLIETADTSLLVLPEFLGLLLLLMAVTLGSQLALTTLGHHFVYRLRSEFIKRILDTHVERIEQLGSASLLAGLTSDVRNITIAFVRLPELVQGIILTIGSAAYLWMLSGKMLLVTAIWMAITIWGGFVLVARVYKHMATLRETANMISFCADAIGIRDDMYLGAGNAYMREVGAALDDGYKQGVLPQRPALVNLQCDIDHPTQSMADLAWLREHFGSLENLKGKKIAMTWAYSPSYGKPLSVPQGIIGLMTRFGMDVTLAHPEGYDLIPDVVEVAKNNAKASGGSFRQVTSMEEAFKDADIVYPKSWAPYKVMEQRTELLRANDHEGLKALEKQCLAQNAQDRKSVV